MSNRLEILKDNYESISLSVKPSKIGTNFKTKKAIISIIIEKSNKTKTHSRFICTIKGLLVVNFLDLFIKNEKTAFQF